MSGASSRNALTSRLRKVARRFEVLPLEVVEVVAPSPLCRSLSSRVKNFLALVGSWWRRNARLSDSTVGRMVVDVPRIAVGRVGRRDQLLRRKSMKCSAKHLVEVAPLGVIATGKARMTLSRKDVRVVSR